METVVIESDGKQEPLEGIHPPKLDTMQDFLDAVRASGLVGLGGAGFPTVVKLTVKNLEQVKAIIINGAECEPYITSDTRTMLDRSLEVMEGARLVQKFLQVKRVILPSRTTSPSVSAHTESSWRTSLAWRSVRCRRCIRRAVRRC